MYLCGQILYTGLQLSQGIPSCDSRHLDWEVFAEKTHVFICFPSMLCPALWHQGCRQQLRVVPGAVTSEKNHCRWYLTSQRQSSPCPVCSAKVTLSAPLQRFVFQRLLVLKSLNKAIFCCSSFFPPLEFSLCSNLLLQSVSCNVVLNVVI